MELIRCKRCVMDTSAKEIKFDENGICNFCTDLTSKLNKIDGTEFLKWVDQIKINSQGIYDCILGISGGVDSCYTALILKDAGINPLLVHIDNGWNTKISIENVKKVSCYLNLDLEIVKLDLDEFKEIQVAFLKSNILDVEIPTDLAIPAILHKIAKDKGVKSIVSGGNYYSEGILPLSWGYHVKKDMYLYRKIVKRFAKSNFKIVNTPTFSLFDEIYYKLFKKIKTYYPLNMMTYNSTHAKKILKLYVDWENYGGKHQESTYTKIIQNYYIPVRWGIDLRKATYSSLICSNQLKREESLGLLNSKVYTSDSLDSELIIISQKLNLNNDFFVNKVKEKGLFYFDFPNNRIIINFGSLWNTVGN